MVKGLVTHTREINYYTLLQIHNRGVSLGTFITFDIRSLIFRQQHKPQENREKYFSYHSKETMTPLLIYCNQSNGCFRIGLVEIYTNLSGYFGAFT